jgi:hypothetical protein
MTQAIRYIGLDVHKDWIVAAVAESAGEVSELGRIADEPAAVRRLVTTLTRPDTRLPACYEAGPTGYALQRQLAGLGVAAGRNRAVIAVARELAGFIWAAGQVMERAAA